MDRSEHEALMVRALRGADWDETFAGGPHPGPSTYTAHWGLPFHWPGETRRGRGTILVDMQRERERRVQYLSLKGYSISASKARPSTIVLATGCGATIRAVVAAARRGNAIPVAIFASRIQQDDKPSEQGLLAAFDAAPWIRESGIGPDYVPPPPALAAYGRGKAPPVYIGYESPKATKDTQSSDWVFREGGYAWYPSLKLSIPAAGIPLVRGNIADLPGFVEGLPWGEDGWYTIW
jgi:hypothetical protein